MEQNIPSPQALSWRANGDQDLISKLPDELIHHIFYFLDMVDVVPTCILSKRWRYLWASLPFLNFDYRVCTLRWDINPVFSGEKFVVFVDKVMQLRNESSNIRTFRLHCYLCRNAYRHVERWIRFALLRNVEELEVDAGVDHLDNLHRDVVTSMVLRQLKLRTRPWLLPIFNPPDSVCLPQLKNMHLDLLIFKDGERISSLISRCPLLETLFVSCWLDDGTKPVVISSLQLQHLEISILTRVIDDHCQITILAPKLLSLTCRDHAPNDYSFPNVSSLVRAEIEVSHYPLERLVYANNITSCLRGLANVKSLRLSLPDKLLEAIFPPAELESMLTPFHNLKFLKLVMVSTSMDEVRAATCLLQICPSLETLVLRLSNYGNVERRQPEIADMFAHCVLPHLKHVEIQNVVGKEAEFKLMQYLLKNAKHLENMILLPKK